MERAKNLWKDKKKRLLWGFSILLVLASALFVLRAVWPSRPSPFSEDLLAHAQKLDIITITATFDPAGRQLRVSQQLLLTNRGNTPRSILVLRTYANAFQGMDTSPIATEEYFDACYPDGFSSGSLVLSSLRVASQNAPANYRYTDPAKTVLSVPLEDPWQPGASLMVDMAYVLNIPHAASRFGENNNRWALGNAFPMPAVWEDGAYRQDPYDPIGDPFVSECANFKVTLQLPQDYQAAGSAWPKVSAPHGGLHTYSFDAPAVRDFALCLFQDLPCAQAVHNGVLLSVYASTQAQAGEALGYARRALSCFAERFGPYPYPSLTLSEVDFPFGGMEYPALVMLAGDLLKTGGQELEWLVVHEVAHQWWYAVVGSDQVNQAWQDEALCEYSLLDYVQQYYGQDARDDMQFSRIETAMRVTEPQAVTPGSPLSYFSDMGQYGLVVYRRGAALFCALDTALWGGLDDFLKAYYDKYRFTLATRADFETFLAEHTGQDWRPLMMDYLDTLLAP